MIEAPSAGQFDVSSNVVAPNLRPSVQFFNDEPHQITEPQVAEKPGEPGTGTVDLPRAGKYYFTFWDTGDSGRSTQPVSLTSTRFTPADDSTSRTTTSRRRRMSPRAATLYVIFPRRGPRRLPRHRGGPG